MDELLAKLQRGDSVKGFSPREEVLLIEVLRSAIIAKGDQFKKCAGCYTEAECKEAARCFASASQRRLIDEAYKRFPDDIEPDECHPLGKITVDRGNLRFAFVEGAIFAAQ